MSKSQPKLRLLKYHRELLVRNAEEHIYPTALRTAYDKAYKLAAHEVSHAVAKKFSPTEMNVLQKYDLMQPQRVVRVINDSLVDQFDFFHRWQNGEFVQEIAYPRAPWRHSGYNTGQMFAITKTGYEAVQAWKDAKEAFDTEYTKRRQAYHALIQGANYLEDLLEIWPEAAQIVPRTNGAIVAMGPEQIDAIKRDLDEQRRASK